MNTVFAPWPEPALFTKAMPCSFWNFKVVRASQTKPMEFLSVSSHCVCDLAGYYVHMLLAALPCGKHVIIEDVFTNSVGVGGHFCAAFRL